MLPWLFVVLVLLNAGLFFWGYQREKSLEPPPAPVPEGRYEIRLLGETREDSRQPLSEDAPESARAEEPRAGGGQVGGGGVFGSTAADGSAPLDAARVGETGVDSILAPAVEAEPGRSEPDAPDLQPGDPGSEPQDVAEPPLSENAARPGRAASNEVALDEAEPDEVIEKTDPVDSAVPGPAVDAPVGDEIPESETDVDAGSAESPAEAPARSPDGLRDDELSAEAPAVPADVSGTSPPGSPAGSEPLKEDQAGAVPEQQSEDRR